MTSQVQLQLESRSKRNHLAIHLYPQILSSYEGLSKSRLAPISPISPIPTNHPLPHRNHHVYFSKTWCSEKPIYCWRYWDHEASHDILTISSQNACLNKFKCPFKNAPHWRWLQIWSPTHSTIIPFFSHQKVPVAPAAYSVEVWHRQRPAHRDFVGSPSTPPPHPHGAWFNWRTAPEKNECPLGYVIGGASFTIWATVNIWYIAPSHQFLKSVLSFSKPQLNFKKKQISRRYVYFPHYSGFTHWKQWIFPKSDVTVYQRLNHHYINHH